MTAALKQRLMHLAEILHVRIFGHEMGGNTMSFLKSLSFSLLGGIVSAILLFVVNVVAGRMLGPEEYGKYSLIMAIATTIIIFTTSGMDTASMYFIAKDKEEKSKFIATSFWSILALTVFLSGLSLIFSGRFSDVLAIDDDVFIVAVIFAAILGCKNLFDALVRGLKLFEVQAKIKIIEAMTVVATFFLLLMVVRLTNYKAYIAALLLGMIIMILITGYRIGGNLSYKNYSWMHFKKIFTYGIFSIIGAISGALLGSVDKILINKYIGPYDVGVYNAYFTASVLLVTNLTIIFINVFFPYVSSMSNHATILEKLNKLAMILFVPSFAVIAGLIYAIILTFGASYPVKWILIFQFSFFAVLNAYFMILWWLIASSGIRGVKFTSLNGIIAGGVFVCLSLLSRNRLALQYVILFLTLAVIYAIIVGNMFYHERSK